MQIKLNELKKIFTSPIIYILFAVFIVFNSFTIISSRQQRSNLDVLGSLVNRFGYKISSNMLTGFKNYYSGEIKSMNALSKQKCSRTYKSAAGFLNDYKNSESGVFTSRQLSKIARLEVAENYCNAARGIEKSYKSLDIKKMGEDEIIKYGLSGEAAATVRCEYAGFAKRFARLIANGEEKNLFYYGQAYSMQSLLFGTVFGSSLAEILILIVLATCLCVNFEFDAGTHSVVYASKRGRRLIRDKFAASLIGCFILTAAVLGVTLVIYFCNFDYSKLLNVPIGSGFLNEPMQTFYPWFNLTFIRYLFACVILTFACAMIFTAIAFCVASFVKNSYIAFAVFVLLDVASLIIPQFMPRSSNLVFLTSFNPFVLTGCSALWFMEKGPFADFRYYEVITATAWLGLMACVCFFCIKRFKKLSL